VRVSASFSLFETLSPTFVLVVENELNVVIAVCFKALYPLCVSYYSSGSSISYSGSTRAVRARLPPRVAAVVTPPARFGRCPFC